MTRGQEGFTLLELIAVLILMALLTSLALPALTRGTSGIETRLCRDQLRRDIRAMKAEAVGKRQATSISFDVSAYLLDFGSGDPIERSLPAGFSISKAEYGTNVDDPEAGDGLVFWPNGRSNGAYLEIAAHGRCFRLTIEEDGSVVWE